MPGRRHFGNVRKLPSGRYQASYWHEGSDIQQATPYTVEASALLTSRASRWIFRRGAWIDPRHADLTVKELASQWLESNPAKRSSTLARDEAIVRLHVLPLSSVGGSAPSRHRTFRVAREPLGGGGQGPEDGTQAVRSCAGDVHPARRSDRSASSNAMPECQASCSRTARAPSSHS